MSDIELGSKGAVTVIGLNRPAKRNAMSWDMQVALADAFARVAADSAVRALVLTGHGGDFCVGGDRDIAQRLDEQPDFATEAIALHRRTVAALLALDVPVIGAVEGAAFGFGAELAACCDVIVLGETARLADPHVRYGRAPAPVLLAAWPQQASRTIAAELILTGREVPADEAVALGLANRVVAAGMALAEGMKLAQALAAMPPRGVTATRRALRLRIDDVERFYPETRGEGS